MTEDEVQALLEASARTRWHVVFRLALNAGLGRGEVLGIQWRDIDWRRGLLHVERQIVRSTERDLVAGPLKRKSRRRTIGLFPETLESLRWWKEELRRAARVDILPVNSWVFPGGHWRRPDPTRPGSPEGVDEAFRRYCPVAGFGDVVFHSFRATVATWMAEDGVSPLAAAEVLGHSNPNTLWKYYTRVTDRARAYAAFALRARLTGEDAGISTGVLRELRPAPGIGKWPQTK